MDTPADASPGLFDEAGVIVADTSCRRCGYNLRGLQRDGRCPECGTPIGLSTHGDLLRFADPEWVEKLALGIKYIIWGVVISIGLGAAGGCLTALGAQPVLAQGVTILGSLLRFYGAWLLTARDPSGIGEDRYITARRTVRFALLVGLLSGVAHFATQALPTMPSALYGLIIIGGVLTGLVGLIGEFAKFTYLRMLAERIPDPNLAGWARFLRWAITVFSALAAVFGALVALVTVWTGPGAGAATAPAVTGPPPATSSAVTLPPAAPGTWTMTSFAGTASTGRGFLAGFMAAACVVGVLGIAVLVFQVMAFVLYIRLGRRFREQAGIARASWAAAVPSGGGAPADALPPGQ